MVTENKQDCKLQTNKSPSFFQQRIKQYRNENKYLKTEKKDRITIAGLATVFAWTEGKIQHYSDKLPISRFSNLGLMAKINAKHMRHYPFLDYSYLPKGEYYRHNGGFPILSMKDTPFVVIDFDDITAEELELKLQNTDNFLKDQNYKIIPSLSGTGSHLWTVIDISFIEKDGRVSSKIEGEVGYKRGKRYAVYEELYEKIVTTLEKQTGLKADHSIKMSHIAVNVEEIKAVNEYFKDKTPSFFSFGDEELEELKANNDREKAAIYADKLLKEKKIADTEKQIETVKQMLLPFFDEFDRLIDAFDFGMDVITDIKEHVEYYCFANDADRKYYREVFTYLSNHREAIKDHIASNWNDLRIYAIKENNLGVGVDALMTFFDCEGKHYLKTYLRHVFLYMLNLKLNQYYVYKKLTCTYDFVEKDEYKQFFSADFLKEYWWLCRKEHKIPTVEMIAEEFGNGNTWLTICRLVPFLVSVLGEEKAVDLLLAGLDYSNANDKNKRRKQIERFAHQCSVFSYAANGVRVLN